MLIVITKMNDKFCVRKRIAHIMISSTYLYEDLSANENLNVGFKKTYITAIRYFFNRLRQVDYISIHIYIKKMQELPIVISNFDFLY